MQPPASPQKPSRLRKYSLRLLAGLAALYLLLLIPEPSRPAPAGAGRSPFVWNREVFWSRLEHEFVAARTSGHAALTERIQALFADSDGTLAAMEEKPIAPEAEAFDRLETNLFELAPLVAACSEYLTNYIALADRSRAATKRQSEHWNFQSPAARERIYRMLYGTRMALEEVMLQSDQGFPELTRLNAEPSSTPSFETHGVRLHSGDILISRGGAPTSALIARGNDFPGSYSHVALLYVDDKTGAASVIESHIECGVRTNSFEAYLQDKKLRILALRLRADLPAMKADPMLPHRAASAAWNDAQHRHIPYDFAMDWRDPQKQFCSEVASAAYTSCDIHLWQGTTFISDPVVSAWLASVGVRYFETQSPADLEYDPQLRVVGEWRDRTTLLKAHIDDAVTDVMLAAGKPGEGLPYQWWLLPFARISKGYSLILNRAGRIGPIPEGMSATEALRISKYVHDHEAIATRLLMRADQFKKEKGYGPPCWELVALARDARREAGFR
jgi:hypothetical protein